MAAWEQWNTRVILNMNISVANWPHFPLHRCKNYSNENMYKPSRTTNWNFFRIAEIHARLLLLCVFLFWHFQYISSDSNTRSPNICLEFGWVLLCSKTGPPLFVFNSTDKGLAQIHCKVWGCKPSTSACCLYSWACRNTSCIFALLVST